MISRLVSGRPSPEEAEDALYAARSTKTPIPPFSDGSLDLDASWGYAVQEADRKRREEAGEMVLGAKLGLTSEAKQRSMGIDRPIVGFLTTSMRMDRSAGLNKGLIHPRCEPEIAFRLGEALDREVSFEEALRLVDASAPAIEVIDSRYEDFRFLLPDVLADNASAAGFVVGDWESHDLDALSEAACRFFVDGDLVQEGQGAAVLGHPLNAVVHLSQHLAERGDRLPAGSLVLSGSITEAVVLRRGSTHRVEVDGFPPVELVA